MQKPAIWPASARMARVNPMDSVAVEILVLVAIAGYAGYRIWYVWLRKCPKCGGNIRLDKYKDSMGHNITKTITVSFWRGPRKNTETYKCRSCNHIETRRYWSWS